MQKYLFDILLGFVVEYPIYSQEHNGRTYTIKGLITWSNL